MNLLDWAQVVLSIVVMLTGLFIALFRRSRYGVLVSTRMASFGLALLGLSYLVGGFEYPLVGGHWRTGLKHIRRWWGFLWFSVH